MPDNLQDSRTTMVADRMRPPRRRAPENGRRLPIKQTVDNVGGFAVEVLGSVRDGLAGASGAADCAGPWP
jgi:hypothetical protein